MKGGGQFLTLRETGISNLSLPRSIEPFKKFVVVVCKPILVISLRRMSRLFDFWNGVNHGVGVVSEGGRGFNS